MRKFFMISTALAAFGYLVVCVGLCFLQDQLLFAPTRQSIEALTKNAAERNFSPWMNKKGTQIGWQSNHGNPALPILILPGNAGYALLRESYVSMCTVGDYRRKFYILEYPGYGARPGPTTEATLTEAAVQAVDTIPTESYLWVIGESLGAAVATAAAAQRPNRIAGLILVTPFDSVASAAREHFPWLPTSWLLRTKFDSVENLEQYGGPVAFIVGENDTTVPANLGEALYESYAGVKRLWVTPGAGHNDTDILLKDWPQLDAWLTRPQGGVPIGTPGS